MPYLVCLGLVNSYKVVPRYLEVFIKRNSCSLGSLGIRVIVCGYEICVQYGLIVDIASANSRKSSEIRAKLEPEISLLTLN